MPTPVLVSEARRKASPCICATASACRSWTACPSPSAPGECAVLGGPSGAGKSSILKMLYGNYAVDAGQIIVEHRGQLHRPRDRQPAHGARRPARHDRLCQPVPAHRAARRGARRRGRTAGVARRGTRGSAGAREDLLARLNLPGTPVAACRRRPSPAASSSASTSRAASSRRIRCCCSTSRRPRLDAEEPRGGGRADIRQEERAAWRCSASSMTPTCARPSPTASSTSRNSRLGRSQHEP